jgi:hypothetical protein
MPVSLSGSLIITGSLTASGTLTAQTLVVQTVTSSIVYSSGSNIFGNSLTDTQQMTGSLRVTGSGNHYILGGNVGIGTSSPLDTYSGRTVLTVNNNGPYGAFLNFGYNGSLYGFIQQQTDILQIGSQANLPVAFYSNALERMRITASGSVLIGKDSSTGGVLQVSNGTNMFNVDNDANGPYITAVNNANTVYKRLTIDASEILFDISAAEKMRLTSGGFVGIDTDTAAAKLSIGRTANTESNIFLTRNTTTADVNVGCIRSALGPYWYDATSTSLAEINLQTDTTAYYKGAIMFSTNNSDATANRASLRMYINAAGSIGTTQNGTNIYNASDIRLKKNIATIENSLSKVLQLNPVKFNWVDGFAEDGKDMLGFIAQEVQDIIPEAVEDFGGEDNIVEIGDLKVTNPLRINEKFIIPVLVKAVQEQQTQIESQNTLIQELTTRLTVLENK